MKVGGFVSLGSSWRLRGEKYVEPLDEASNLLAARLLARDPVRSRHRVEPVVQALQHQIFVPLAVDQVVEPVVPHEGPGEADSRRRCHEHRQL